VEQPLVLRVVDAGDDARDTELLLGEQRHHEVVLVVTGDRSDDVGLREPRLLELADLARVGHAEVDTEVLLRLPGLLHHLATDVEHEHVVSRLGEVGRHVLADLAGADDDDAHQCPFPAGAARWASSASMASPFTDSVTTSFSCTSIGSSAMRPLPARVRPMTRQADVLPSRSASL